MHLHLERRVVVATVLAAAAVHGALVAQTTPPGVLGVAPPSGVFSVDVVVLDRDGRGVSGLRADDFTLSVDGRTVPIVSFAGPGVPTADQEGVPPIVVGAASPAPAPDGATAPAPAERAAGGRSTLAVFLDEASLSAAARERALDALAAEAARSLVPGDRLMIAAGHGSDVDLLLPPSSEPEAIAAGFAAARARPALSTRGSELRQLLSAIANAANPNGESAVESRLGSTERDATLAEIRQYAARRQRESLDTVAALGRLVDALGGVDGRRAVVVVSGGLSSRPAQGPIGAWVNRFQSSAGAGSAQMPQLDTFDRGTDAALTALSERANGAGVTLYGLGLADVAGGAELAGERVWSRAQQDTERGNVGQSLGALATATGGTAVENAGDLGAVLRQARADGAAAYTLGFVAGSAGEAARQRLQVAVRDPALVVRHRSSLPAETAAARLRDRTLAALLFGGGDNPLELKLQVESAEPAPPGQQAGTVLQLVVTLPLARLSLLPHGSLHEGGLHMLFGSLAGGGRLSDLHAVEAPIRIANDQLLDSLGRLASYRVRLTLRPVAQRLAVGVLDDVGGMGSTTVLEWSPDAPAAVGSR